MAKKVRRVRRYSKNKQSRAEDQESSNESASPLVMNDGISAFDNSTIASKKERNLLTPEEKLRKEYSYVLLDLRRIAILAAVMFALLILLNVLLQ